MLERYRDSLRKEQHVIEAARKRAQEYPASKERWDVNVAAITISGTTATGKTTISVVLGEIYKIPEDRNIKVGQIIREIQGKKEEEGYIERPIDLDREVDGLQKEILTHEASLEKPFIIEGRLAGVIAEEEKSKNPNLSIVSILLTASNETIKKRVRERNPQLSDIQIHDLVADRSMRDMKRWVELHPQLRNSGPYDPNRYDIVINTDNKSVEKVFRDIHEKLKRRNLIRRMVDAAQPKFPDQGQIFPN